MDSTLISVIIVNYNTFQLTCECIESVKRYTFNYNYEIIVVDNHSTEINSFEIARKYPYIKLVQNPENSGFAAGNNLGISKSSGDIILLLNSDTYLVEDSISLVVEKLLNNSEIGVIGCRMLYPDGKIQHTARRFRSISWELLDLFRFIPFILPYKRRSIKMLGKYFEHNEDVFCDWVNGAFFMFKKELLDKLPQKKLDDRFFMYGEDHLWCWQFTKLGFKNYFYSDTKIIHINNASTLYDKRLRLLKTMFNHELEIMKERKGKGGYYFMFKFIYGFKEYGRILVKSILYKLTGKLMP